MTLEKDLLIKKYNLSKHIEGGMFKEYYRCKTISTLNENRTRELSTSIYFMLDNEEKSNFHKLKSDEIWYYHLGCSLSIYILDKEYGLTIAKLGNPLLDPTCDPVIVIPANKWFAASLNEKNSFCFLSCSVSPGFSFDDFELAKREKLLQEFENYQDIILKHT